ncbi:MAG: DUF1801 domain-containing protein [Armatimonadetes bacterium]|nr:DUF1801 domain-containing protein [Armatimonadota bacterium]
MPKPTTIDEYLAALPPDRREIISAVRDLILRNLPEGYIERFSWGMIAYQIPLERYRDTYNHQPLMLAGLANNKGYCSLHLVCVYMNSELLAWLQDAFREAGLKLNMGKACVRFKTLADLPLEAIGQLIARVTPEQYIAHYEAIKAART